MPVRYVICQYDLRGRLVEPCAADANPVRHERWWSFDHHYAYWSKVCLGIQTNGNARSMSPCCPKVLDFVKQGELDEGFATQKPLSTRGGGRMKSTLNERFELLRYRAEAKLSARAALISPAWIAENEREERSEYPRPEVVGTVMKDPCPAMGWSFAGGVPSKREVVCRIDGHLGADLNPVDAAWDALLRRVNAKPNVVTTAPPAHRCSSCVRRIRAHGGLGKARWSRGDESTNRRNSLRPLEQSCHQRYLTVARPSNPPSRA